MCEYSFLRNAGAEPISDSEMQPRQLKSMVESGHYKPEPALVAAAMLERRGVRELLGSESLMRVGRIPLPSRVPRRAA